MHKEKSTWPAHFASSVLRRCRFYPEWIYFHLKTSFNFFASIYFICPFNLRLFILLWIPTGVAFHFVSTVDRIKSTKGGKRINKWWGTERRVWGEVLEKKWWVERVRGWEDEESLLHVGGWMGRGCWGWEKKSKSVEMH